MFNLKCYLPVLSDFNFLPFNIKRRIFIDSKLSINIFMRMQISVDPYQLTVRAETLNVRI